MEAESIDAVRTPVVPVSRNTVIPPRIPGITPGSSLRVVERTLGWSFRRYRSRRPGGRRARCRCRCGTLRGSGLWRIGRSRTGRRCGPRTVSRLRSWRSRRPWRRRRSWLHGRSCSRTRGKRWPWRIRRRNVGPRRSRLWRLGRTRRRLNDGRSSRTRSRRPRRRRARRRTQRRRGHRLLRPSRRRCWRKIRYFLHARHTIAAGERAKRLAPNAESVARSRVHRLEEDLAR